MTQTKIKPTTDSSNLIQWLTLAVGTLNIAKVKAKEPQQVTEIEALANKALELRNKEVQKSTTLKP